MKSFHFLLIVFLLSSCLGDTKKTVSDSKDQVEKPKPDMSSELVNRLYANYIDNPVQQAHKDQNAIIEFAVEHNLDAKRTNSGLYYVIHEKGKGPNYISGQPCKAHYKGYFLDGKIFDSSYQRNQPIMFNVGQMNAGWNEAIKLMNSGTKAQLLIPSRLAYGERGFDGYVPPNTPIAFDLHLLPLM